MVLQITITLASAGAHVLVYFCGTVGAIGRGDGDEKEGSVAVFGAGLGWGDLSEVWEGALFGEVLGICLSKALPILPLVLHKAGWTCTVANSLPPRAQIAKVT